MRGDAGGRAVCYLDFDGVVLTARYAAATDGRSLNPFACADVADLLARNDMLLVVCSTWREDADCRDRMRAAGLPLDRLHPDWRTAPVPRDGVDFATGDVVVATRPTRQAEVEDHAARNGIGRYVLLDDDASVGGEAGRRQVRPDPRRGLTPKDLARAQGIVDADEGSTTPRAGDRRATATGVVTAGGGGDDGGMR